MRNTRFLMAVLVVGVVLVARPSAQRPQFDVASVKTRASDGDRRIQMEARPGGRFIALNVPLRLVIRTAYQLQNEQIIGGPDWLQTDRFDIEARADLPGLPGYQLLEMLKSLLAERFAMTSHTEKRELSVFALERARGDGSLGPKLQVTACPDVATDLAATRPCATIQNPYGTLLMRGMPFTQIVPYLSPIVSRVVVDRTGLTERYDFELKYTPERPAQVTAGATPSPAGDPDAVSIFTAMQEQLGLRLTATKDMVDVLVIDTLEPPTPN